MNATSPLIVLTALGLVAPTLSLAATVKEQQPDPKATGKIYEWTTQQGTCFQYLVPKTYDHEAGATLTLILHGSNLDRQWGFANHQAGKFRPFDIVVCPDGTTSNDRGGFNFLGRPADAASLTALISGLRSALKITDIYLYGHSQGSFFALYYAGENPGAVTGVLAHASGVWTQTKLSPTAHHQAIVLMHGTADPVVPYTQSLGGYRVYRDKGYPTVRLRSLEGWNHWPAEHNSPVPHASQQLAWIEGMTTRDPVRLAHAYGLLLNPKDKSQHDFDALNQLATRIGTLDFVSDGARSSAIRTKTAIAALAEKHIAAMKLADPDPAAPLDGSPWIGHLPMFLRAFPSVPTALGLAKRWQPVLDAHDQAASNHFTSYWSAIKNNDQNSAFEAGLQAIQNAFLSVRTADPTFLANMDKWSKDRSLKIAKEDLKSYKDLASDFADSQKKGRAAFESTNKRARL